ncbi:hypothetical protein Goarm_003383, partial [Gossypium armourianum]|nr:hypothetical protein [Gossypium armourianum]
MGSGTVLNKFISDPFTAEAIACLQALNLSREMYFSHVQIEGDSRTMIVKINQVLANYSDMGTYIKEIKIKAKDRFWMEELPATVEAFLARDLSG